MAFERSSQLRVSAPQLVQAAFALRASLVAGDGRCAASCWWKCADSGAIPVQTPSTQYCKPRGCQGCTGPAGKCWLSHTLAPPALSCGQFITTLQAMNLCLQGFLSLYPMLLVFILVGATLTAGQHDVAATIPLDPAAARIFPSGQFTTVCGIITIQGLGSTIDGDYSLVNELALAHGKRPTWIGMSLERRHHLLSWQSVASAWTIGIHGLSGIYRAFVQVDSDRPPAYSSRWRLIAQDRHIAEKVDHVVSISCPVCTAISVATLPDGLVPCNGPYRRRAAATSQDNEATRGGKISTWSHVSDERCTLLHDKAGNSVVTLTSSRPPYKLAGASEAREKQVYAESPEWWTNIVDPLANAQSSLLGAEEDAPRVVCTSAGQTTRLVVDLIETAILPGGGGSGVDGEATVGSTERRRDIKFKLLATQDGSIVSGTQGSNIRLQIHRAKEIVSGKPATATAEANDGLYPLGSSKLALKADNVPVPLHVQVTGGGAVAMMPLEVLTAEGVLLSLPGKMGTLSLGICLRELRTVGEEGSAEGVTCLAETLVILEIFSPETYIVRRRPSSEVPIQEVPSASMLNMAGNDHRKGMVEDSTNKVRPNPDAVVKITRVAFVVDLQKVDGYKLSTLHLIRHLPEKFRASALDLSCASGELPVKDLLGEAGVELVRICLGIPRKAFEAAEAQHSDINMFLYSILANAANWEKEFVKAHPDVARALAGLHAHLTNFDTLVFSNGGKDRDAYLLEIARLAGVKTRMVNLGPLTGGYVSPLFSSGATMFIGPSQYVAHNPAVIRNAGKIPVKVCHPVMDAARVLKAACSCPRTPDKRSEAVHLPPPTGAEGAAKESTAFNGKIADAFDVDVATPPTFIMVGQLHSYKTPGLFVRAMGVLQRRMSSRRARHGVQQQQDVLQAAKGTLIGKGYLLGPLQTLAQNVNASVTFAGFLPVDVVPCWVKEATALVIPSTSSETFGMVGPEAMILGVPVITFGFGGTGELVRHMENGVVVAEDPTPRALADAMQLLAVDKALRDRLGAQARLDGLRALSLPEIVACHADEF